VKEFKIAKFPTLMRLSSPAEVMERAKQAGSPVSAAARVLHRARRSRPAQQGIQAAMFPEPLTFENIARILSAESAPPKAAEDINMGKEPEPVGAVDGAHAIARWPTLISA
jgi:hypothetical protein